MFMLLLSIVFITFPLVTGILAVKCDKTLGFKKKGGFGVVVLPVVARQRAEAEAAAAAAAEESGESGQSGEEGEPSAAGEESEAAADEQPGESQTLEKE